VLSASSSSPAFLSSRRASALHAVGVVRVAVGVLEVAFVVAERHEFAHGLVFAVAEHGGVVDAARVAGNDDVLARDRLNADLPVLANPLDFQVIDLGAVDFLDVLADVLTLRRRRRGRRLPPRRAPCAWYILASSTSPTML
jgi:hypothetical protein